MKLKTASHVLQQIPSIAFAIAPADNVPMTQTFDEGTGAYNPDRSVLPLILVPTLMSGGSQVASTDIINPKWFETQADGTETQITDSTTGYELYPTGYPLSLKITKNTPVATPTKLRMECKAKGLLVSNTVTLYTTTIASPTPRLELNYPTSSLWNPYSTEDVKVKIKPTVFDYGQADLSVEWLKLDGENLRAIDTTDPEDCEIDIDTTTQVLTLNRRNMGDQITLMARLMRGTGTNKTKIAEVPVTVKRMIPSYRRDLDYCSSYEPGSKTTYARALIELTPGGLLDNPAQEMVIEWYSGNTKVGEGNDHYYPTSGNSVEIGFDEHDRGCVKMLTYNGKYLEYGGKLITNR